MKLRCYLPLTTLALAMQGAAVSAQDTQSGARDFQLPPAPTPTATPQVQGPVDTDAPLTTRPRVIPTDRPTAAPTPAASPTSILNPPPATQPRPTATRAPAPQRNPAQSGASQPSGQPPAQTQPSPTTPAPTVPRVDAPTGAAGPDTLNTDTAPTNIPAAAPLAPGTTIEDPGTSYFGWLAAFAGLVILLGGAFVWWRRQEPGMAEAPIIEPPLLRTADRANDPAASPDPADAVTSAPPQEPAPVETIAALPSAPIQIKAQALSLSRSMMNATLAYRFELMNIGTRPLGKISVSADMVTAHGKAPIEDQVAQEHTDLPFLMLISEIDKKDSHEIKGEFRLPINAIRLIPQGKAQLFVPLLRLRVVVEDMAPIVHTFVVGMQSQTGKGRLNPFRLDEMAQTYRTIGMRALG